MTRGRIAYSATALAGPELGERIPRRVQSRAADALLTTLSGTQTAATSKSHSRALIAAAAGEAKSLKLGIDVEWMAPHRPFDAIMRSLVPSLSCKLDCESFYRCWTFAEAYYKAFQELPGADDVETVVTTEPHGTPREIGNGAWIIQHMVLDAFALCLVWKGSQLCTVEYLPSVPVD